MENLNWVREYNKLFATLDDPSSYFKGSAFIHVVKEFDPYHADYSQYMEFRRKQELSTSRKTYFYDILMAQKEDLRKKIIGRLYEVAKEMKEKSSLSMESNNDELDWISSTDKVIPPIWFDEVENIEEDTEEKIEEISVTVRANTETIDNPIVFISYSWDDEEHKTWILNLSKRLFENGVEVILDRYELRPGASMTHFMETAIKNAHKVLVVFTPNYKMKAENREGGVGYEYSILNGALYYTITNNTKIIPIMKSGSFQDSIPDFMKQFIAVDMSDPSKFEHMLNSLLLSIYDKPQLEKPELGRSPF